MALSPPEATARRAGRLLLAVLATAVAARIVVAVPGAAVPQSLQTLAVVLVGVWLGARDGALAMAAYVALGTIGLPLFAEGGSGVATLAGPSGGYLAGFLLGAAVCGAISASSRWARGWRILCAALAAHVVILGAGWLGLLRFADPRVAWQSGVAPFVVGGIVKSACAALLAVLVARTRRVRR